MRVLHISKTSDGARWAALQVRELVKLGVEVDVALPSLEGRSMNLWNATGARLHAADLHFSVSRPWEIVAAMRRARAVVDRVRPDLIHSHFVSTTLTLRAAFGRHAPVPRVFQVPGPLHLEHWFYRRGEIASANSADYWIASSRCTRDLYVREGIPAGRVFLSYYAIENSVRQAQLAAPKPGALRARLRIPPALAWWETSICSTPPNRIWVSLPGSKRMRTSLKRSGSSLPLVPMSTAFSREGPGEMPRNTSSTCANGRKRWLPAGFCFPDDLRLRPSLARGESSIAPFMSRFLKTAAVWSSPCSPASR